ncbi:MAG: hypothetical protein Q7K55_05700 [Candidatus Levybacteria bacterium]|nr:hypothetical protein [Candidatus Levybacteria bacterium]
MKNTILKKPTTLQMGIGLIISICKSLIKKQKNVVIPQKIGKYQLVSDVKKENLFREYGIGIYQYRGKKVFIKTWTGFVGDFQYYELINEYFMTKALYKEFKLHKYIKVPKIISYVNKKGSFSIIYEFVKGKNLSFFSGKKQVEVIHKVLNAFDHLSTNFTKREDNCFSKRTLKFYILSLTFLSFLTILSNLGSFKAVLRGYISFLKETRKVKKNNLRIAHRDLNLHNILIKGKYVFLIDCARVALTYRDYDIAYLSINPKFKKISKEIGRSSNYSGNLFLESYILINQARSFSNPAGFKNFYLEELHKRYG